jgi:hypothetical protein
LALTFTTASNKITLNNGVVSQAVAVAAPDTLIVSVKEGVLTQEYSLKVASYDLSIGTFPHGSVTSVGNSYSENDEVTLTIAPATGYELDTN